MKVFDVCDSWHIFQSWCEDLISVCLLTGSNGKANLYKSNENFSHISVSRTPKHPSEFREREKS